MGQITRHQIVLGSTAVTVTGFTCESKAQKCRRLQSRGRRALLLLFRAPHLVPPGVEAAAAAWPPTQQRIRRSNLALGIVGPVLVLDALAPANPVHRRTPSCSPTAARCPLSQVCSPAAGAGYKLINGFPRKYEPDVRF